MFVENCLVRQNYCLNRHLEPKYIYIYIYNNQGVTVRIFFFFSPSELRYSGRPPPNSVLGSTVQLRYSGFPPPNSVLGSPCIWCL